MDIQDAFESVGGMAAGDVVKTISQINSPPLKDETIEARKRKRKTGEASSKPLVFDGILIGAIDSRVQNDRGQWISAYKEPVTIKGSWQPVSDSMIQNLGLDASKRYFNLYTSNPIQNVQQGESPDKIIFNGYEYDVVGEPNDWHQQDGWRGIMCVEVGRYEPEET